MDTEAVTMCAPGSGGDESASVVRHELYVGIHAHNHPPSNEVMRTAIPAEAMEEAKYFPYYLSRYNSPRGR